MTGTAEDRRLLVVAVNEVGRDIRAYTLESPGGEPLAPFEAGAHVSVTLPSGLVRDYSLCSDPADRSLYRIAIKREPAGRGGSHEAHTVLHPGVEIPVSAPRNHFALPPGDSPVLLLAGGIGITPILSMLPVLRRARRRFRLVYLAASRDSAAFADDLVPQGGEDLLLHLRDRAGGRLDLLGLLSGLGPDWQVMCCGPLPMIEAAEAIVAELGWDPSRFRREVFRARPVEALDGDRGFDVTLARSGMTVSVAADQTLLDALLHAGIDVDFSCEEGTCGTCITGVLAGDVDHRDHVLTSQEREGRIVLCCSRSKGAGLVLDL